MATFIDVKGWEKDHVESKFPQAIFLEEKDVKKDDPAEIVAVYTFMSASKDFLSKFPNLKLICSMSTGYDHIDLEECKRRGIRVCTVPNYGERTVAEYALGLMLGLLRKIPSANEKIKAMTLEREGLLGQDLQGKTIGVIGTGKIGRNVIRLLKPFDVEILAYDAYPDSDAASKIGFRYVSLEDLFKFSEVITIHAPLLPSTKHMIDQKSISLMQKKPFIINTARGGIIDTQALADAIEQGAISGAALDVFEYEKNIEQQKEDRNLREATKRLINHENVIMTPHLAFFSEQALKRILDTTIQSIVEFENQRDLTYELKL